MHQPERDTHQRSSAPPDPSGRPEAHDVLAAEEFGIGTRDERWPVDPAGYERPHDILAAEAFAMPLPDRERGLAGLADSRPRGTVRVTLALTALLAGLFLLRRRAAR